MKIARCIICLVALFSVLHVQAEKGIYFLNTSTREGLSQTSVNSIVQDKRGYMWFGTRDGLNRYNGHRFDIFRSSDEKCPISDNNITSIVVDNTGYLWVGTTEGLNRVDTYTLEIKHYFKENPKDCRLPDDHILSLALDAAGVLWVGTRNGVCRYNPAQDDFTNLKIPSELRQDKFVTNAIACHKDGNIYFATNKNGVVAYNPTSEKFTHYSDNVGLQTSSIRQIFIDNRDRLWIAYRGSGMDILDIKSQKLLPQGDINSRSISEIRTFNQNRATGDIYLGSKNGLWRVDSGSRKIKEFYTADGELGSLSHYSVLSIFFDNTNSLWIGTYLGGIDFYSNHAQLFKFISPMVSENQSVGSINQMVQYKDDVYIATDGSGLMRLNPVTLKYTIIPINRLHKSENHIRSLFLDKNTIYCGTNLGHLYAFDIAAQSYKRIFSTTPSSTIYAIDKNANGDIILGCVNEPGILLLNDKGEVKSSFETISGEQFSFGNVRAFLLDDNGAYFVGTRNMGLWRYNPASRVIHQYRHYRFNDKDSALGSNYITDICKSSSDEIFVATFGGGLAKYDRAKNSFDIVGTKQGLSSENIYTALEDNRGFMWVSTDRGISKIDFESRNCENFSYPQRVFINEFSLNSGLLCSDGTILMGGINGIIYFNPAQIDKNPVVPPVYIESIHVKRPNSADNAGEWTIQRQITAGKSIALNHNQRDFSIDFAALNYILSSQNQYSYKLEGFDKRWSSRGGTNTATYTNIPAGRYTFRVIASNNDGIWNEQGAELEIVIHPHPLLTVWAILCYIIIFVLFALLALQEYRKSKALKAEMAREQMKIKVKEEFHQDRIKLFTNFSHEIRTPLTLIISPLDAYASKGELDANFPETLRLMRSNAHRMLRIVNNLMDFSKKEVGKMTVSVSQSDLAVFCEEMYLAFSVVARNRNIDFHLKNSSSPLNVWFDQQLLEKVFFNLLSNAFKNTLDAGSITISSDRLSLSQLRRRFNAKVEKFSDDNISYILIEVIDDGLPIGDADLERIFTPFFSTSRTEHAHSGTGIGLSLTKSIIELHNGTIWAQSDENGVVMRFIIPDSKEQYSQEDIIEQAATEHIPQSVEAPESEIDAEPNDNMNTILIIEDNGDIRNYLSTVLGDEYRVITASNGEQGLAKARSEMPELIITDLMMPKVDGLELTRTLKGDIHTSHIPIIILSARTSVSQIQEGYSYGADDYIIKPFNVEIIKTRIVNILETRDKLKRIYSRKIDVESLGLNVTSVDELFIQKLYKLMEQNISKTDLTLDDIASEIGMSKSSLYRKMKSVVNITPNEFIRNFRLEMAAKLLVSGNASLTYVYEAVGFNSHAYFSYCFRKVYRMTPSEYVRSHNPQQE